MPNEQFRDYRTQLTRGTKVMWTSDVSLHRRPLRMFHRTSHIGSQVNTLRAASFKLFKLFKVFKPPFPGFLTIFNFLNAELKPICYLLALLAHHFLHVSRIRVKSLTLRLLMSYIYIGRSPAKIVGLNPTGAWIFVCCECRVLSGRGLCDELITRPEESYRLCCVVVCDIETSRMGAPYI